MATLADVAALAGCSKSTVSRALARPEMVAPETVARVAAAVAELDFVPNRTASQLARGRTGLAAFVVPTLENAFFAPIIGGAQARAAESDLHLTVAVQALETPADVARLGILAAQVDGMILAAPRGSDAQILAAGALKPTVLVDREIAGTVSVIADTATAVGTVVAGLAARGHTHIAYLGGPSGSWQDPMREAAARAAADAAGARLTVLGPFPATFAAGISAVDAVVAAGCTAVVPYATAIGLGLMLGLRGRDIVIMTEGRVAEALGTHDVPDIVVDGEQLGRVAMNLLLATVRGEHVPAGRRLPVEVRWSA